MPSTSTAGEFPMQITNILVPVDGSSFSVHAVECAIDLAKVSGARVCAVNCYELLDASLEVSGVFAKEVTKSVEDQSNKVLEKAAQQLQEAGVDFTTKSILGSPGKVLPDLARSKEFDLIIMGSHGHSNITGLFLGSVTHKVLNTIYCPVMVVP
jgi:nucleotide-binding universal stress UspA family protein